MGETAQVRAIDAIRDFRARLIQFQETAQLSLAGITQQLQRAGEWIEQDRPAYWRNEVKRGFERVAEARSALATCQMRQHGDFKPSCYEEREALRAAQRRLQIAQEKVEFVKRAATHLRHEFDEYRGRAMSLETFLLSEFPNAVSLLERIAQILDQYAGIPPSNVSESISMDTGDQSADATESDAKTSGSSKLVPTEGGTRETVTEEGPPNTVRGMQRRSADDLSAPETRDPE